MTIHLATLHYTPTTLTKEKILDNHRSVLCSFGISTKMKNWIYRHSHGFLNYTSVLSNSVILLDLQIRHETSFQIIKHILYRRLKPGSRVTVTLATRGVVWILRNSKDLLEYIQFRSLSACNLALKHLTSLPSTQLFLTLS